MPIAMAVKGAASARPKGPATTASKSGAVMVSVGGKRTIWRWSKGVMMFPSRKCTRRNRSITRKPLIGLIATASRTAGTTERIGPTFGMKVSDAAMIGRFSQWHP